MAGLDRQSEIAILAAMRALNAQRGNAARRLASTSATRERAGFIAASVALQPATAGAEALRHAMQAQHDARVQDVGLHKIALPKVSRALLPEGSLDTLLMKSAIGFSRAVQELQIRFAYARNNALLQAQKAEEALRAGSPDKAEQILNKGRLAYQEAWTLGRGIVTRVAGQAPSRWPAALGPEALKNATGFGPRPKIKFTEARDTSAWAKQKRVTLRVPGYKFGNEGLAGGELGASQDAALQEAIAQLQAAAQSLESAVSGAQQQASAESDVPKWWRINPETGQPYGPAPSVAAASTIPKPALILGAAVAIWAIFF